jgi:CRISPR-associated endonuclease Csn1
LFKYLDCLFIGFNKVLCFEGENRNKADRTPIDAWGGDNDKWNQITQAISQWKFLKSKVDRFYMTEKDLKERYFISSQLTDTRYTAEKICPNAITLPL